MLALILPGNSARNRFLAAPVHPIPVGQATSRTKGSWRQCTLCLGNRTNLLHRTMIGRPTKNFIRLARRCPSSPYGFSVADVSRAKWFLDDEVIDNVRKKNLIWLGSVWCNNHVALESKPSLARAPPPEVMEP